MINQSDVLKTSSTNVPKRALPGGTVQNPVVAAVAEVVVAEQVVQAPCTPANINQTHYMCCHYFLPILLMSAPLQ